MRSSQTLVNCSLTKASENHSKFKIAKNLLKSSPMDSLCQIMSMKNNKLEETIILRQPTKQDEERSATIMFVYPIMMLGDNCFTQHCPNEPKFFTIVHHHMPNGVSTICTSKLVRKFQKLHEKTQIQASICEASTKMPFTNKKGTSRGDATPQCDHRTPFVTFKKFMH